MDVITPELSFFSLPLSLSLSHPSVYSTYAHSQCLLFACGGGGDMVSLWGIHYRVSAFYTPCFCRAELAI